MEKQKRIEDYDQVICLVSNEMILDSDVDRAPDALKYRVTRIKCKRLNKRFETTSGNRIAFAKLMKLGTQYSNSTPYREVYCEEGDVEEAVKLIQKSLDAMVKKWQRYFSHVAIMVDQDPEFVYRDE